MNGNLPIARGFQPSFINGDISDTWRTSGLVIICMHGVFSLLIGLLFGLFILFLYCGLLKHHLNRLSLKLEIVNSLSILGTILCCLIQVLGSYNLTLNDFNYALCGIQDAYDTAGTPTAAKGTNHCYGEDNDKPWMKQTLFVLQFILVSSHSTRGLFLSDALYPSSCEPLISDGMIAYRTQALIQHRIHSKLLIVSWMLPFGAALGVIIEQLRFANIPPLFIYEQQLERLRSNVSIFIVAFTLTSTLCNLFATISAGVMLWRHRRHLRKDLGFIKPRFTHAQRVLVFVIESGCLYCLIQFAYIIVLFTQIGLFWEDFGTFPHILSSDMGSYVFQQLFTLVSGLYPVFISMVLTVHILYPQMQTLSAFSHFEDVQNRPVDER